MTHSDRQPNHPDPLSTSFARPEEALELASQSESAEVAPETVQSQRPIPRPPTRQVKPAQPVKSRKKRQPSAADRAACRRKVRYPDRIAALFILSQTGARHGRRPKDEVRAYECPACSGWHLSSRPSRS